MSEVLEDLPHTGLAYADLEVFEHLARILPQHCDHTTTQAILGECRESLLAHRSHVALRDVHTVMRHCRRCPDMVEDPWMPKWNLANPTMVLVGEVHSTHADAMKLLVEQLREAQWTSQEVALTYITRCVPNASRAVADHEIANCVRYLWNELDVWQPQLIVTMGVKPTEVLFHDRIKISDVRGRINWLGPWAVLPTYGPAHALRSHLENDLAQDLHLARSFCYGT